MPIASSRLQRLALGVDGVVGEPTRARHVRPRQSPASADAGLVVMRHWRAGERLLDVPLDRREDSRRLLDPAHQRPAPQP